MEIPKVVYNTENRIIYKNGEGIVAVCFPNSNKVVLYDKTKQEYIEQQFKIPFEIYCISLAEKEILKDRVYNTIQMSINSPSGYPFYIPTNIFLN